MNMKRILLAAAASAVIMSGCANGSSSAETSQESKAETESTAESNASEAEDTEDIHIMLPTAGPENADETTSSENVDQVAETDDAAEIETEAGFADNFAVGQAQAAAFAEQIKAAVASKDIEALADLAAYPLYVGFSEGSEDVRSKDEFIALGADRVFTDALLSSIAAADTSALSPSMAGFALSDGDTANIIFGVRDGSLAISGINY